MVTGFYYSFCLVAAIAISLAIIVHGRIAAIMNAKQIVSADANMSQTVSADVNMSQIVVVTIREAIIAQLFFLIRSHHVIQIVDAVKTLFSQEDSLQVQQPVVVK